MQVKNVIRIVLLTLGILIVPLIFQLTIGTGVDGQGWNWTPSDFIVVGVLIFFSALMIHLAWIKMGKYRALGAIVILFLFLWLWAELAVGVFTNWGS